MTAAAPTPSDPVATASTSAPAATPPAARLAWLDALRGMAVLAVVVQHSGELSSKGFARVTHRDAQLGQAGVLLFFLVSGFVIPMTLSRRPGLRRFVVTRLTRLYPAYWVSILVVYLCWHAKLLEVPRPFRHDRAPWLANLTMLQTLLGRPQLQGQYWSLVFELIFYALCGLLLAFRLFRHTVALAGIALAGALALHLVARATSHTVPLGLGDVATMFVGSMLWRVHNGDTPRTTGWAVYGWGFVATQLLLVARLAGASDGSTGVSLSLLPMCVAWGLAYLVFGVAFHLRHRWRPPRVLLLVGEVSYSVYLLHPVAISVIGSLHPAPVAVGAWTVGGVALGWVSWHLVERPAGRLGHRSVRTAGSRRRDGLAAERAIH